jgi:hypothetical protein
MSHRRHNKTAIVPTAGLLAARHPGLDLAAITHPPAAPAERAALERDVDAYITQCLDAVLSDEDRQSLNRNPKREVDDKTCRRVERAFDGLIVDLARTLGWRLLFSDCVRDRVAAWMSGDEPDGLARFEEFWKQLHRGALAQMGKAKLPVGRMERHFKQHVGLELRSLQRLLRARQLSPGESLDAISEIVHRDDCPFPGMLQNWTSFRELAHLNPTLLPDFATGTLTPALLVDKWIAAARNRSVESVRQDLTQRRDRRP